MAVTIKYKGKPSNKAETLPKSPFIDKITAILKPENEQDAHDIYMGLFQSLDDPEVWLNAPKGKGFNLGKRIKLPSIVDQKRLPLFQARYDTKNQKIEMIRLEFVPVDLGPVGMAELHAVMMIVMDGGWEYMAKHGHISRIDVSVDLPGVRMDGFQFLPKYSSTTMRWPLKGVLQNVAYGKPKGNQTLIYNRKTKRQSKGQKWRIGRGYTRWLRTESARDSIRTAITKGELVDIRKSNQLQLARSMRMIGTVIPGVLW